MKHLVFTLLAALVFSGAASAQRLMVGVRGGVNFADYSFVPTRIGDTRFTPGAVDPVALQATMLSKAASSLFNAAFAFVVAPIFFNVLRKPLRRLGLYSKD